MIRLIATSLTVHTLILSLLMNNFKKMSILNRNILILIYQSSNELLTLDHVESFSILKRNKIGEPYGINSNLIWCLIFKKFLSVKLV